MTVSLLKEKPITKLKSKPRLKIPNAETVKVIREIEVGVNLKKYACVDDFFKEFQANENN